MTFKYGEATRYSFPKAVAWPGMILRATTDLLSWPEIRLGFGLGLLDAVLLLITRFTLTFQGTADYAVIVSYCLLSYALFTGKKANTGQEISRRAKARQTFLGLGAFTLFSITVNILDYQLTGTVVLPEWDSHFAAWDLAIGFHWLDWYHFVLAHPAFHTILQTVYGLLSPEIILLFLALPLSGHVRQGRRLLWWYMVSALVTITVGILLPARGAFVYYHLPIAAHTGYVPVMADLRNGTLSTINILQSQGLVVFPSFHAALAVLCAAAAWSWKWLRYPFLLLNGLIIVSAPSQGGHYGVDVIAGILLALITILFVRPKRAVLSTTQSPAA